ncbi:MAG: protein kinase, partial [Cyanobacteria bacterium HKST-UBA02]|nr:protein kinase [Cyanobacteria bacterium HKST-UBA02]
HRDIKPANIMVADLDSAEPSIRILDFGIAMTKRSSQSGIETPAMAGTPLYMSPDEAQGRKYDEQSEIYSMGCVIYEMVTGEPPFEAENAIDLIAMHAVSEPPDLAEIVGRSKLTSGLSEIVIACLAKDSKDRPASMIDLEQRLSELPVEPEPSAPDKIVPLPPVATGRPVRFVYAAGALAAILTAAAVGISLMSPSGKLDHITDKGLTSTLLSHSSEAEELSPTFVFENAGKVAISESTTTDADLEKLAGERRAGKIRELRLINPTITSKSIVWLKQLHLKTLWIKNSSGTMSSTQILFGERRGGESNEQLNLTDGDIGRLLEGTGLSEIQLEGLPIEGTCFKSAAGTELSKIRLMDCPVSDAGLAAVSDVGTPTWLCLRGADAPFSGKGLSYLSKLKKLEVLEISINNLEPGGTTELGNLKNLRGLHIFCDRKLRRGELGFLSNLPRLNDLSLAGYCMTEDAIDSLAGLNITHLTLRNTNLDDRLLSRLPPLPLETIILDDSLIEGNAAESLARLKNLKAIGVAYCRRLTPDGLDKLRKGLPGRLINRGEDEGRVEIIPYVPAGR